jgi:poly-beta-1,6-N-acetyl-D-glucosamine biosynthesis protein PgaD
MNTRLHARATPLILSRKVPRWLIVRDLLLTVSAWLVIVQSMRYVFDLLYDYLSAPIFKLTRTRVPTLLEIWTPLKAFVLVAVFLVIWLAVWAFYGTRRLRKAGSSQPAPLPISEHANYLGLKPDELALWKTYRIAVVTFDAHNRIAEVSRRDLASTVATAAG